MEQEKFHKEIPKERANFLGLLNENANYFGTIIGSNLDAVQPMKYNTTYEELKCLGLEHDCCCNELRTVFTVKLPFGFNGNLCSQGSWEYVRFFIDLDNDGDFNDFNEDLGVACVNVHDIPQARENPLCYATSKGFCPPKSSCRDPLIVRARAILSWQSIPTGPNFVPVWGNVIDCWVQISPTEGP